MTRAGCGNVVGVVACCPGCRRASPLPGVIGKTRVPGCVGGRATTNVITRRARNRSGGRRIDQIRASSGDAGDRRYRTPLGDGAAACYRRCVRATFAGVSVARRRRVAPEA